MLTSLRIAQETALQEKADGVAAIPDFVVRRVRAIGRLLIHAIDGVNTAPLEP
jgi:hypothetical protein